MRANLENVVGITVTGNEERLPMLIGTMSSVLANVENLTWWVYFQYEPNWNFALDMMKSLAEINNNQIVFNTDKRSMQAIKGATIEYLIGEGPEYVFNIDDDMIYDAETLNHISKCTLFRMEDFYIVCQFDVDSRRDFDDYDQRVRTISKIDIFKNPEFKEFIQLEGEHVIAHHLWKVSDFSEGFDIPLVIPVRAMSSGWIVKIKAFKEMGLIEIFKEWPQNKRGYDIFMSMAFTKVYKKPLFIVPTRGYHIGLAEPYYNSNWKEHDKNLKKEWEGEFYKSLEDK